MLQLLHPAMKMTRAEKLARAEEKRRRVMHFLASGEGYSTISILSRVMGVSEQTALPALKKLVEERMLRVDKNAVPFSNLKLWGISDHGLAVTETADPRCSAFVVGRTSPNFVAHHIDGQHVRLNLEQVGWTNYVPGRLLLANNDQRQHKCIPDALVTSPNGCKVAIEIERHVKSRTRLAQVIAAHLQQVRAGQYKYVYYFTPHHVALERAFLSVPAIKIDVHWVKLTDGHRSIFRIFDMDSSPKEIANQRVIIDLTL